MARNRQVSRRAFVSTGMSSVGMSSVGIALGCGCFAWPTLSHAGAGNTDPTLEDLVTTRARQAVARGLGYLAAHQTSDGAFGSSDYGRNVGVCGLAGMALMAGGSTPNRGPYGRQVNRCVRYVLDHVQDNGFIVADDSASHGPMYGHGFATLFLAEVYGMAPQDDLREKLSRAVRLIVDTQNDEGGWRYQPQRRDADLSVTICEVMALRAARNAGIHVPNETIRRCVAYVKRSQNEDGGFMYLPSGGPSAFPRSAAGVVALFSAGVYQGKEVELGLDYLAKFAPTQGSPHEESHFFYGHYYAVQAMWHAGGQRWRQWYPAIRNVLIQRQSRDGSWESTICAEYGTAMATIILQMPNNYLPIFQR